MALFSVLPVFSLSIPHVSLVKGTAESFGLFRDHDEMNMIRHQAICPHLEMITDSIFGEPLKIDQAVFLILKDIKTIIAALRNVVRQMFGDYSSCPWHEPNNSLAGQTVKKNKALSLFLQSKRLRWVGLDSLFIDI